MEPSGPLWCARFPGSNVTKDMLPDFRDRVDAFISVMRNGGAGVVVAATWRPPERAYLMHWCCKIAGYTDPKTGEHVIVAPGDATPMAGVAVDWTHAGNTPAARAAAEKMVSTYAIRYPAALTSRHTQRRAVDMTIGWTGTLKVRDFDGVLHKIDSEPRNGSNAELIAVGKTFGVIKLVSDPPHWSDDGH